MYDLETNTYSNFNGGLPESFYSTNGCTCFNALYEIEYTVYVKGVDQKMEGEIIQERAHLAIHSAEARVALTTVKQAD